MYNIDIDKIDRENFRVTECEIAGEKCYLINPIAIFADWTEENLIFRSSLWNSEGHLISAGFPKFFNFEEKPSINPFNADLSRCSIIEKIDGTCLIVSKYEGQLILRTRGTVDARQMSNGHELDLFLERFKNSNLDNKDEDTWYYSLIFEWVSPKNQIVLRYDEPDFYYINCIDHWLYRLTPQYELDYECAYDKFQTGTCFKRPQRYQFDSITDLIKHVEAFEGKEGVVLCYDEDQHMRKIKGKKYLALHAFRSKCTINTLLDLFFEWNEPTYNDFLNKVETQFDYECMTLAQPLVEDLYCGVDNLQCLLRDIQAFVQSNKNLEQKEFALKVVEKCGDKKHLSAVYFAMRKGLSFDRAARILLEELIP